MKYTQELVVIMPCRNEADNITEVISNIRKLNPARIIIGIDPATTDNTRTIAEELGCSIAIAERSGYDPAVHRATLAALENNPRSLLLYTDAGNKYGYDQVSEMIALVHGGADMVLAVRTDANKTMLWHQKLGTQLILLFINILLGKKIRDISPFRLVKSTVFNDVAMDPKNFRWTSELLVKALTVGMNVKQVNVVSLPRKGTSKVSSSVRNSLRAGLEMISSIKFVYTYRQNRGSIYVSEK